MSNLENRGKVIEIKPIRIKNESTVALDEERKQRAELLFHKAEKAMQEAEQSIEKMLGDARQKVKAEQEDWEKRKTELEEKAKDQGFQEGYETGRNEGYKTYVEMIQQAVEVVEKAKQDYETILLESEDMVLHLAMAASSKILNAEVKAESGYVEMVKHIIKEVKEQTKISVYAHPEDYQVLLHQKEELINIVHFDADLAIYPDSELNRGACIIESPYGRIDAGIDSQLQEMRNKLFDFSREADSES